MKTLTWPKTVLLAILVFGLPATAHAYVGPGAGISLIGAAIGLIVALATAIGIVVLWPLRRMRLRARKAREAEIGRAEPDRAGRGSG